MKHNIKKIPAHVRSRLIEFGDRVIVAACTRQFSAEDIANGALRKFGIHILDIREAFGAKASFEPRPEAGRYSRMNCRNTLIVHKNEPKIQREFKREIRDWHGNPHDIIFYKDCYRRSIIYPKHIKIDVRVIRVELDTAVLSFRVDEAISSTSNDFDARLMAGLNLLQENIGACNVELAETVISDYQHVLSVPWQIFPPGVLSSVEVACRLFRKQPNMIDEKNLQLVMDRYNFLHSLQPRDVIIGQESFHGYVGGRFDNDIVVFDNVRFGNAVYILRREWEALSKKTKGELIHLEKDVYRVPHNHYWKLQVQRRLAILLGGQEVSA